MLQIEKAGVVTGQKDVDAQHEQLFLLTARLASLAEGQVSREAYREMLDKLQSYVALHFHLEEELMDETGYPDLEGHKRAHEAFEEMVSGSIQKLPSINEDELAASAEKLAIFLKDWLVRHIGGLDFKYAEYSGRKSGKA